MKTRGPVVVLICAGAEWRASLKRLPRDVEGTTPFGEWCADADPSTSDAIIYMFTGWGKIAAAAATQHAIDRWHPRLVINIGTCGGFHGCIGQGEIILAQRTVVYDITELMGDRDEAIAHYVVELTIGWSSDEDPFPVWRAPLVSADRDLHADEIPMLRERFGAVAADWESGAIAWIAERNRVPVLILRGVSDLVGDHGGEAYGALDLFIDRCGAIMEKLVGSVKEWVALGERMRN